MTDSRFDIAIIGGGMAGGTLALSLSRLGYSVCLLESREMVETAVPPILEERTVALSHSSVLILQALGIWSELRQSAEPIAHIEVTERGRFGSVRMSAQQENVEALGFVIRNSAYLNLLYLRLSAQSGLRLLAPCQWTSLQQTDRAVQLRYRQGDAEYNLQAGLLIAADGTHSAVRTELGIDVEQRDYQQSAIITNISSSEAHQQRAFERFTDTGPLALLPLPENAIAVVYTVNSDQVSSVLSWTDQQFLAELQTRFGYKLGRFQTAGPRFAFPLSLVQAKHSCEGRIVLIGNAVRTLHPVAGQGFNLALRDIAGLVEALSQPLKSDPGQASVLRQYVDARAADRKRVVQVTDSLASLFRGRDFCFSHLRAAGLLMTDSITPLRRAMARQSMGLSTRLAALPFELSR